MSVDERAPLDGAALTEIVLAVEGVTAAFPPPSVPQLLAAVTGSGGGVAVAPDGDGVRIDARIATRRSARSADAARAVADALTAELGTTPAHVHIQIARIH